MKALTVLQPRASLIVRGLLPVETQPWGCRFRGRLAIHAGEPDAVALERLFKHPAALHVLMKRLACDSVRELREELDAFPTAHVVGAADLADCVPIRRPSEFSGPIERALCDLSPGRIEWFFHRAKPLNEPVPERGGSGLWEWAPPRSEE